MGGSCKRAIFAAHVRNSAAAETVVGSEDFWGVCTGVRGWNALLWTVTLAPAQVVSAVGRGLLTQTYFPPFLRTFWEMLPPAPFSL